MLATGNSDGKTKKGQRAKSIKSLGRGAWDYTPPH